MDTLIYTEWNYQAFYEDTGDGIHLLVLSGKGETCEIETIHRLLQKQGRPHRMVEVPDEVYDEHLNGEGFPELMPAWIEQCEVVYTFDPEI